MRSFKISQSITDRQDASLNSYFKDVFRQPMISQEEEIDPSKVLKNVSFGDAPIIEEN